MVWNSESTCSYIWLTQTLPSPWTLPTKIISPSVTSHSTFLPTAIFPLWPLLCFPYNTEYSTSLNLSPILHYIISILMEHLCWSWFWVWVGAQPNILWGAESHAGTGKKSLFIVTCSWTLLVAGWHLPQNPIGHHSSCMWNNVYLKHVRMKLVSPTFSFDKLVNACPSHSLSWCLSHNH